MTKSENPIEENLKDNEIINIILLELYKRRAGLKLNYLLANISKDRKRKVLDIMTTRNLIELGSQMDASDTAYKITDNGVSILAEHKNYLSFIAHTTKVQKQTTAYKITPIIIAASSFILASVFGVLNYTKGEEIKRKDAIIKKQSETIDMMKKK